MSGSFSKLSMLSELRGKEEFLSRGAVKVAIPPSSWESLSVGGLGLYRNLTAKTIRKITKSNPAAAPTIAPNHGPVKDNMTGDRAAEHNQCIHNI